MSFLIDWTKERPHSELPLEGLKSLATLAALTPPGNFAELGVFQGGSAWVLSELARSQGRKLHLFDTFTGLPEASGSFRLGQFSETSPEVVQHWCPEARLFVGLFPDSLTEETRDLAFAHIDCDLRSSCEAALERLWPLLVEGGVMAFDDWPIPGIQGPVREKFGDRVRFTEGVGIAYVVKG